MADINIPGISDKYKTNDLVNSLVEVEKIPLKREQDKLEAYKTEQSNWRRLNQYMSSLRESARTLYSYDNPFNERTASSSDERAITASPTRDANLESFRVDVIQTAGSDRFLSKKIDKNQIIPEGTYKFTVGEKTITYRWKGGKISDFSAGLNKRGNGVIKSSFIGVSKNETSFLIESLKTGSENKLIFEDDAFKMALDLGIVEEDQGEVKQNILKESFSIGPQSENEIKISDELKEKSSIMIRFKINSEEITEETAATEQNAEETEKTTESENQSGKKTEEKPQGNFAGKITFKDITVYNEKTSSISAKDLGEDNPLEVAVNDANLDNEGNTISEEEAVIEPSYDIVFAKMKDGSVKNLGSFNENYDEKSYSFKLSEYDDIDSIFIQNKNADRKFNVSDIQYIDVMENLGYKPVNPISEAQDAMIKYEGITMERPTNEIDDIIENITLEIHEPTTKTATITIENDAENSKDA
ncbi:MAG: flagellar filament capping protein FliD, partial [Treponemataceae bacterium]|nr:flagellar filament capping protein FliD [Treponemataceae bacterium]